MEYRESTRTEGAEKGDLERWRGRAMSSAPFGVLPALVASELLLLKGR